MKEATDESKGAIDNKNKSLGNDSSRSTLYQATTTVVRDNFCADCKEERRTLISSTNNNSLLKNYFKPYTIHALHTISQESTSEVETVESSFKQPSKPISRSLLSRSVESKKPKPLFYFVGMEHLIAGVFGGVASTLILHPLDLVKIRFAVSDGLSSRPQYNGLFHAFKSILKDEGFRGLYRGVTPNVWGAGSAYTFYFTTP